MKDKYVIVKRNIIGEEDFNKEDGFYWEYRYKGVYNNLAKAKEQLENLAEQCEDIEWNSGLSFNDKRIGCEILITKLA